MQVLISISEVPERSIRDREKASQYLEFRGHEVGRDLSACGRSVRHEFITLDFIASWLRSFFS
jgi:hypothetical protein